jgi:hypothetical protein
MSEQGPKFDVELYGPADAAGLAERIWPGQKALLSTADDVTDPAVRLYLSRGWRKLGVLRPGTQVMGRPAQQ